MHIPLVYEHLFYKYFVRRSVGQATKGKKASLLMDVVILVYSVCVVWLFKKMFNILLLSPIYKNVNTLFINYREFIINSQNNIVLM